MGIIYTEKVPIEVGRPKLRLRLSEVVREVEVQGKDLDITLEGGRSEPATGEGSDNGSVGSTEQLDPTDVSHANEDLELLEQELKEAISSN